MIKTKNVEKLLRVTDKDRNDLSTISFGTQLTNLTQRKKKNIESSREVYKRNEGRKLKEAQLSEFFPTQNIFSSRHSLAWKSVSRFIFIKRLTHVTLMLVLKACRNTCTWLLFRTFDYVSILVHKPVLVFARHSSKWVLWCKHTHEFVLRSEFKFRFCRYVG